MWAFGSTAPLSFFIIYEHAGQSSFGLPTDLFLKICLMIMRFALLSIRIGYVLEISLIITSKNNLSEIQISRPTRTPEDSLSVALFSVNLT